MVKRAVGIGASAGGVDALTQIVGTLRSDLSVAILVVLHIPAASRSLLAPILDRRSVVPVSVAAEGEELEPGRVYVASPDRHLVVEEGRVRLVHGPKENGARPSVDPLLRSLASAYGPDAVAVILSGALGDGRLGALAVKRAGGVVIVQDPADATVPSMPESALQSVADVDLVLPAAEIGPALHRLTKEAPAAMQEDVPMPPSVELDHGQERPSGPPSAFTCPECHGSLWEIQVGEVVRYRCRVGHAYSQDAMIVEQGSAVEAALWSALKGLEERVELLKRVAETHGDRRPHLRDRFLDARRDAQGRADLIRGALGGGTAPDAFNVTAAEAAE